MSNYFSFKRDLNVFQEVVSHQDQGLDLQAAYRRNNTTTTSSTATLTNNVGCAKFELKFNPSVHFADGRRPHSGERHQAFEKQSLKTGQNGISAQKEFTPILAERRVRNIFRTFRLRLICNFNLTHANEVKILVTIKTQLILALIDILIYYHLPKVSSISILLLKIY